MQHNFAKLLPMLGHDLGGHVRKFKENSSELTGKSIYQNNCGSNIVLDHSVFKVISYKVTHYCRKNNFLKWVNNISNGFLIKKTDLYHDFIQI